MFGSNVIWLPVPAHRLAGELCRHSSTCTPMGTATPFPETTPAYQAQVTLEPGATVVPSNPR